MTQVYKERRSRKNEADNKLVSTSTIISSNSSKRESLKKIIQTWLLGLFYLMTGIAGFALFLKIVSTVLMSNSISPVRMIIIFLEACIPLVLMSAGLYGFAKFRRKA